MVVGGGDWNARGGDDVMGAGRPSRRGGARPQQQQQGGGGNHHDRL